MAMLPQTAFAEPRRLDSFTGEIEADYEELTEIVKLSNKCYYDRPNDMYIYTTSSVADSDVRCSAFDGMITTYSVSIETEINSIVEVYRDGELVDPEEYEKLSAIGKYSVIKEDGSTVLAFEIINDISGTIDTFHAPEGFTIYDASLNNEDLRYKDDMVDMKAEGVYMIKYKHEKTGASYTLELETDFSGPELEFDGLDENNVAHGPVTITIPNDVYKSECYRDEEVVGLTANLKNSGNYEVIVYDEAGNSNQYIFRIAPYMNFTAWMAVLALVGIIGGMIGYLVYAKKNLRVR